MRGARLTRDFSMGMQNSLGYHIPQGYFTRGDAKFPGVPDSL